MSYETRYAATKRQQALNRPPDPPARCNPETMRQIESWLPLCAAVPDALYELLRLQYEALR